MIKYNNRLPNRHYRFANGFGADARRKRHTADSGYGSEQPLDRRWSQDFSQDVSIDVHLNDHHSGDLILILLYMCRLVVV